MDYVCPSCKSDNIQRLAAIYEGGMSEINTKSKGTAIGFLSRGGIGVGVGAGETKGTSQTASSKRAAPPAKKPYLKPLAVIFGFFFFVTLFVNANGLVANVLVFGWIAASAGWIYLTFKYNSKTWPPLKAKWDTSYLCNRCNEIFSLSGG